MISNANKSPSGLDPHYIRVENFELDTVDLAAAGSNTPAESLWEILEYEPHYTMGECGVPPSPFPSKLRPPIPHNSRIVDYWTHLPFHYFRSGLYGERRCRL